MRNSKDLIMAFEGYVYNFVPCCTSEEYNLELCRKVLELLKEQQTWIEKISEYKQSVIGKGMHELSDYEQGKIDGLQSAYDILNGER